MYCGIMRILIALCAVWIWIPNEILLSAAADINFLSGRNQSQQNTPDSDANWVSPEDPSLDDPDTAVTPPVDPIDHDTIQCIYYETHKAECQTECSDDPVVLDLDPARNMKVMQRECRSRKKWKFVWSEKDGVLDASVFPNAKYRHQHEICAICTFSKAKNKYFDCAGIAVCHPERRGIDQCSGGLPWRGIVLSGDPLKEKSPKGNITSYAQNSISGGGGGGQTTETEPETTTRKSGRQTSRRTIATTSESVQDEPETESSVEPETTTKKSNRRASRRTTATTADSASDEPETQRSVVFVYFVDPFQRIFSHFSRFRNIFAQFYRSSFWGE